MDNLKNFLASLPGRIIVTILTAGIIYGILLISVEMNSFIIAIIDFVFCAYFGWKALNFITPNIFLVLPLAGWALYYLIKGILSFLIGFVIAPFQIGRMVSNKIRTSGKTNEN